MDPLVYVMAGVDVAVRLNHQTLQPLVEHIPLGYKSVIDYSRSTGVTKPSGLSVNTEQST